MKPSSRSDDHGESGNDVVGSHRHGEEDRGTQEAAQIVDGVLEIVKVHLQSDFALIFNIF